MLAREDNELITRVGPGTPMGDTMRRYWMPALLAWELPEPDCPPVRVKLLGEDLVAFRDTSGRIGLLDEYCPHRRVSLFFGRNEECGLRCVYHGWKFDVDGHCVDMMNEPEELTFQEQGACHVLPHGGSRRHYLGLHGTTGAATASAQFRLDAGARDASSRHESDSGVQLAAGVGRRH